MESPQTLDKEIQSTLHSLHAKLTRLEAQLRHSPLIPIQKHPVTSLAVSVGAGLVLSQLVRKRALVRIASQTGRVLLPLIADAALHYLSERAQAKAEEKGLGSTL